ncbi:tyrosine-type recombinase/integrase [Streptomyces sp. NPDC058439]|uniref:tyrosine-type recombinase/integrase n=1 Tax=Streptomyces sp. NPDC058439 TaxID=3346500 RepID=UPI00364F28B4
MLDRKTGEQVDFLFTHRAKRLAKAYINTAVIPSLCRKAGVPTADVRGNITSHRARSTIASQLYNAKEPMTLFELQAWLGHRSPESTQALRQGHPQHPHEGIHRGRLLRPQRPHGRGPSRPRRHHLGPALPKLP